MIYPIVQQMNVDEIVQKVLPEIQGEIGCACAIVSVAMATRSALNSAHTSLDGACSRVEHWSGATASHHHLDRHTDSHASACSSAKSKVGPLRA